LYWKLSITSILLTFILVVSVAQIPPTAVHEVSAQPNVPYILGNWTYVSKPVYPVKINASQIPVGANWTFVYTLKSGTSYHIYFYGDWIGSETDYDIYVFNPLGELESIHTEAAGLPEHLGNTVEEPYFTPRYSGNYSFLIVNDPRESHGAEAATLMVIEHLECNEWNQRRLEGKVNNMPVMETAWAYEFVTSSKRIEVWIEVPDTLDMYEARLYMMANPSKGVGTLLNGVPLAWEPGLYGEIDSSAFYGGYNLDSRGFKRPDATASCEYPGQDMLINYTSPYEGETLYHLVLIGENGTGILNFMVKTDFEAPMLSIVDPIERAYSDNETVITVDVYDEGSTLKHVLLNYTTDDWRTWSSLEMSAYGGQRYVGTIPGQKAGSTVKYIITASDTAENVAEVEGSYVVKNPAEITISLSESVVYGGENVTVTGWVSPNGIEVTLNYTCGDVTVLRMVTANTTGFFSDEYTPDRTGNWTVSASWPGNETYFEAFSGYKNFTVTKAPTSVTYSIDKEAITIGEKVSIKGSVEPAIESMKVVLTLQRPDGSIVKRYLYTGSDGGFSLDFKPDLVGSWRVQAKILGDDLHNPAESDYETFQVNDTWINTLLAFIDEYKIYIIISAGGVASAVGFILYRRRE